MLTLALYLALLTPQGPTTATPTAELPSTQSAALAKPPCRNPDASGKYRIGCGVTSPIVIYQVEPRYTDGVATQKLVHSCFVTLTVDAAGNPTNVQLKLSNVDKVDKSVRPAQQLIEDSMVDAVKQYKFKPATFEGKPVPVELNVEIFIDPF